MAESNRLNNNHESSLMATDYRTDKKKTTNLINGSKIRLFQASVLQNRSEPLKDQNKTVGALLLLYKTQTFVNRAETVKYGLVVSVLLVWITSEFN